MLCFKHYYSDPSFRPKHEGGCLHGLTWCSCSWCKWIAISVVWRPMDRFRNRIRIRVRIRIRIRIRIKIKIATNTFIQSWAFSHFTFSARRISSRANFHSNNWDYRNYSFRSPLRFAIYIMSLRTHCRYFGRILLSYNKTKNATCATVSSNGWLLKEKKIWKIHKIDVKQNKNSSPWRGKAQLPQPKMITKMVGFFECCTGSNFLAFSLSNFTDRVIWSSSNAQSVSNDHHIWLRGQFWSTTIMDSRRRVIFNAIGREWRYRCDSKRPGVSSFRTVWHETNYLI